MQHIIVWPILANCEKLRARSIALNLEGHEFYQLTAQVNCSQSFELGRQDVKGENACPPPQLRSSSDKLSREKREFSDFKAFE